MNPSTTSRSGAPQLEDVPELLHRIQSRLPVEEAARTSLLSKSWLHAWSTIPFLRFCHNPRFCKEHKRTPLKLIDIDRTLKRYVTDNIPIETFELAIEIVNQQSASLVENWFRLLATKTRVKELFLMIIPFCGAPLNLPYEIFSSENLSMLSVITGSRGTDYDVSITSSHDPVIINCASLRKLHLDGLRISQEILDGILSSCSSLELIDLTYYSKDLNTVKIINLPCLYKLTIDTDDNDPTNFVISHLPNLGIFHFDPPVPRFRHQSPSPNPFNAHSISLGSSVTQLSLGEDLITNDISLDIIKSGFPFLDILSLDLTSWMLETFDYACDSIKQLWMQSCPSILTDIKIHAPNIILFQFYGESMPSFLFPISTLKLIDLRLNIEMPVDTSFFLKMREALALSRKCDIHITTDNENYCKQSLDIDMDDLRRKIMFPPARNVHRLSFKTRHDDCMWERSSFFDAFFEICHPKYVFAMPDGRFEHNNHFCRLMLKEVLEKNETGTVYWPHVQIRNSRYEKWEDLTDSHTSFLDGSAPNVYMDFKLNWC